MNAEIIERITLKEIPSASGIEFVDERFFIVGDNSPWLFETALDGTLLHKHRIGEKSEPDIIPKPQKHDYEAMMLMEFGEEKVIVILGSGSNWPMRNKGVLFSIEGKERIQNLNLQPLYQEILNKANLDKEKLNIEAAATLNGNVYLFNRGENNLFVLDEKKLAAYLSDTTLLPEFYVWNFDLPEVDGIKAGFSGATALEKEGKLLFTASVENTADWVKDGEVLASFIGIIDPAELEQYHKPYSVKIEDEEGPINIKAESITLLYRNGKTLECALVTDSDGGSSELLRVAILLD